ncbi:MAG: S-layer homology domain-containing protein [Clostridiaceae bacterium]|nr:S-layer homology domain-containing protein [Clostridiaceae bacterium]
MKTKIIIISILLLLFTTQAMALDIPGYEGGIKNERLYREVIFITGEPILLEGTLDLRRQERGDRITERYTYRLSNPNKEAELTRTVNIDINVTENRSQTTHVATLSNYRETIKVGETTYATNKDNHQWSKSNIYQNKPGVTYFAGNWDGRKLYTINGNEGEVAVETQGTTVGYEQYWGTTETQTITHYIHYQGNETEEGDGNQNWQGTAEVSVVHNYTKDYHYESNVPSQISFSGGYLLTEKEENVLKYSYNLPRNVGTQSTSLDTNPQNTRLTIPAMRDISGHWAEKDILFLASKEALYPDSSYFGPTLPMNRGDFARAISVLMGISKQEEPNVRTRTRTIQADEKEDLFIDVSSQNQNKKFIEAVYEKGIMQGVSKDEFHPSQSLTRAQAVTVLIRTLGFEGMAPIQQYSTGFRDDNQIPLWAKDAVYVAREIGLVAGTPDGYFQPQKNLTKAEAATMLMNFVNYLQQDLRYDYRERILNY